MKCIRIIILLILFLYPINALSQCTLDADCDDSVACTIDVCLNPGPSGTCSNTADNNLCIDAFWCNGDETCDEVEGCQSGSTRCGDDGLWCNGTDSCNETLDTCEHSGRDCDDGVACTVDSCDDDEDECIHLESNYTCRDALYCNGNESCDSILGCVAGTSPCIEDGLYCNGTITCNETTDSCETAYLNCNDDINCTLDGCDEDTDTCTHTLRDAYCNDYLYCTGTETCTLAGCVSSGNPCDDSNVCTTDTCIESTDSCINTCIDITTPSDDCCDDVTCGTDAQCTSCDEDSDCDDGLYCNGPETCNVGTSLCQDGTPPDCNDDNACTNDLCYEAIDDCVNQCNAATSTAICCADEACGG